MLSNQWTVVGCCMVFLTAEELEQVEEAGTQGAEETIHC